MLFPFNLIWVGRSGSTSDTSGRPETLFIQGLSNYRSRKQCLHMVKQTCVSSHACCVPCACSRLYKPFSFLLFSLPPETKQELGNKALVAMSVSVQAAGVELLNEEEGTSDRQVVSVHSRTPVRGAAHSDFQGLCVCVRMSPVWGLSRFHCWQKSLIKPKVPGMKCSTIIFCLRQGKWEPLKSFIYWQVSVLMCILLTLLIICLNCEREKAGALKFLFCPII